MRRQLAAAVAANRNDGEVLSRRRVGERIDVSGGEVVQGADELIHQETVLAHRRGAAGPRLEAPADLVVAVLQRCLEQGNERHTITRRGAGKLRQRSERLAQQAAVDDLALFCDGAHESLK